jgi:NitT/TauT family transport system substrate-binding protein
VSVHHLLRLMLSLMLTTAAGLAMAQSDNTGTAPTGQRPTVRVGVSGRPDQASLELALYRGYWERQGLDVSLVGAGTSAQDAVSALATNQIQVSGGSPSAGFFNALARGINIRIVADWSHMQSADDSTFAFVVRSDLIDSGRVKSFADLKGLTIAAGPVKGGYNDLFLALVLAKGHLTMADINPAFLPFPDGLAALASKKLDAGLLIEPTVTQAESQGIAKVFAKAGEIDPGAQVATLFYSPDFAAQTDVAVKFMVGYLQGARDFYDAFHLKKNQEAAIATLTKAMPFDSKLWHNTRWSSTDLNGKINPASIKAQGAFYKEEGLINGPVPDIEKYIDTSFADAAVKIIGPR